MKPFWGANFSKGLVKNHQLGRMISQGYVYGEFDICMDLLAHTKSTSFSPKMKKQDHGFVAWKRVQVFPTVKLLKLRTTLHGLTFTCRGLAQFFYTPVLRRHKNRIDIPFSLSTSFIERVDSYNKQVTGEKMGCRTKMRRFTLQAKRAIFGAWIRKEG